MALNPNQWTTKTQEAFAASFDSARNAANPELTVDHLLAVLVDQPESIVPDLLKEAGLDPVKVARDAKAKVAKLPQAHGGSDPRVSRELSRVMDLADKHRVDLKDEYLSVEHLVLGMNEQLGVKTEDLLKAMKNVRGSHRVTSQNPEGNYKALEKYGRDLTEV
ncbi:MAG: Clp protease N-terminal domain-containing protein, partial [Acidimicrobiia bacterium]